MSQLQFLIAATLKCIILRAGFANCLVTTLSIYKCENDIIEIYLVQ